ncbi:MAG: hypothetical protein K2W96_01905 [Gemmataceae bacterium]|nr:hypothetical protein [Gemmataceae bacterium]
MKGKEPVRTHPGAIRSWEIYKRVVKPTLKAEDDWKFITIDIISEDFEIDHDPIVAYERLRQRRPDGDFWGERVGEFTASRQGWHADEHESPPYPPEETPG